MYTKGKRQQSVVRMPWKCRLGGACGAKTGTGHDYWGQQSVLKPVVAVIGNAPLCSEGVQDAEAFCRTSSNAMPHIGPLCDIPSGCCSFTRPWTVTRSSLRMLRRVAAFCRPLRPVLLLVSFPRLRSPVVGVPGLC